MSLDNISPKGVAAAFSIVIATTAWAGQQIAVGETATQQLAQTTSGLSERTDLINACRYSPNALDVFADANRTRRLLTIAPNTQMTLTGVVGNGIAAIHYPAQGWVSTATVESCSTPTPTPSPSPSPTPTPSPSPTPTPSPSPSPSPLPIGYRACYRTVTSVNVRTGPSGSYPAIGFINSGAVAYATTNPPREAVDNTGRIWVEINFLNNSIGWFSRTGAGGAGTNAVRLPDEQCG